MMASDRSDDRQRAGEEAVRIFNIKTLARYSGPFYNPELDADGATQFGGAK